MGYQSDDNTTENHVKSEKESASARLEKILGYGRFQKQQESVTTEFYSEMATKSSFLTGCPISFQSWVELTQVWRVARLVVGGPQAT